MGVPGVGSDGASMCSGGSDNPNGATWIRKA